MAGSIMSPAAVALLDQALIRRVRSDDEFAFAEIVKRYGPQLLRFAVKLLNNPCEAEDAVQDAFLRAYLALRRDERPIRLAPWLHTIVRNCAIDQVRRPAHRQLIDEPACQQTTSDEVEARERMASVISALADLPARQRNPLLLHVLADQPYAQIAQDHDVSVAAVKALISRARRQLRAGGLQEAA